MSAVKEVAGEARAGNVVEALARVARDLPGIGKDSKAAPDQGGYAYRGIEAITRAVQPLLAREGIVFVPSVQQWDRDVVLVGRDRKEWHDDRMLILYRVYGPGGTDDVIEVGPIPAIGRDGTDKGANKCMTQAFKYALLQALCVADSRDDGDQEHHEAERPPEFITETQALDFIERMDAIGKYPERWVNANLPDKKNMRLMLAVDFGLANDILTAAENVGADVPQSEAKPGTAAASAPTLPAGDSGESSDTPSDENADHPASASPGTGGLLEEFSGEPFE